MTTNRTGVSLLKWSLTGLDRSLVFVTETFLHEKHGEIQAEEQGSAWMKSNRGPADICAFAVFWVELLILGNSVWSKPNSTLRAGPPECAMWEAAFRNNNDIYFKYDRWKLFSKIRQLKLFSGYRKVIFSVLCISTVWRVLMSRRLKTGQWQLTLLGTGLRSRGFSVRAMEGVLLIRKGARTPSECCWGPRK